MRLHYPIADRIQAGENMFKNDYIISQNGRYSAEFQQDGNFVVYVNIYFRKNFSFFLNLSNLRDFKF